MDRRRHRVGTLKLGASAVQDCRRPSVHGCSVWHATPPPARSGRATLRDILGLDTQAVGRAIVRDLLAGSFSSPSAAVHAFANLFLNELQVINAAER
jgi:hypothetical protein